ncbi:MAG: MBOAT family protein [Acidobacteriota bacterium]|nr:MBOAT family protein [Acidobacteriota bacterium]
MIFNSLTFIVFFLVVLALHNLPLPWRAKKFNLLVASYIFYAVWNPPFVLLLVGSTVIDWIAARRLSEADRPAARRFWLGLSLLGNLGALSFFKYGNFLLQNWQAAMSSIGVQYQAPEWNIILPVGISFYTFQTLSYTLDVYLRRSKPLTSFLDFALFVTFFPQLVAGPIVRPGQLVPQFATPRIATARQLAWGLALMTVGLFEKVVIADGALAPTVDAVFGARAPVGFVDAWIGTLAFSGQIFCDFAGYSTTAIGAALCLGFSLPNNFRYPYAAIGFSDFWRRWHISLSTWLRDYLYIPLGGNRRGVARTYVNLLLTMLIGGLWHGANWTFVAWGGLHGLYLAVERWLAGRFAGSRAWNTTSGRVVLALVTYLLVNITWVFFRSPTFGGAAGMLIGMAGLQAAAVPVLATTDLLLSGFCILAIVCSHWIMRDRSLEELAEQVPTFAFAPAWATMLFLVITSQGSGEAFIYFQF